MILRSGRVIGDPPPSQTPTQPAPPSPEPVAAEVELLPAIAASPVVPRPNPRHSRRPPPPVAYPLLTHTHRPSRRSPPRFARRLSCRPSVSLTTTVVLSRIYGPQASPPSSKNSYDRSDQSRNSAKTATAVAPAVTVTATAAEVTPFGTNTDSGTDPDPDPDPGWEPGLVCWSGHPVCGKRYHFIIKADGNSIAGYHKPCIRCGDLLHLADARCKSCNHVMTEDDVEDWVYHQLEDTTHLLHGVVHANGFGHLFRVNGREGGSRVLSGCNIINFWDRLCQMLGVRKVSVMDVSKKYGLEYRFLHAITNGHPWYGNWGYEFGVGGFGLTRDDYNTAVETLATLPLSILASIGRKDSTRLVDIISFYQSISDHELVNLRNLFSFMMDLIRKARKASSKVYDPKSLGSLNPWTRADVVRVEDAMIRVLRAVSGSNWVSLRALRGAVCRVGPPQLLDQCLKELDGKAAADGMIVRVQNNPDSGAPEYRLVRGIAAIRTCTSSSPIINCPSAENLLHDLRYLYESILHPETDGHDLTMSAAQRILDCKQFLKDYKPRKSLSSSASPNQSASFSISCHVEVTDDTSPNAMQIPEEIITLPSNATISDLKLEASKAFQEVYIALRRFQAEEAPDLSGYDDSTLVKLHLASSSDVVVRIRGRCNTKNGLARFRMERGDENWTVECVCGAKDDDGERMLACDSCSVWQHTRCSGIYDYESVPAQFVCGRCDETMKMLNYSEDSMILPASSDVFII